MGGIYARAEGLPEEIWKAIYFHYLPVGVEADAPPTRAQLGKAAVTWAAVSLADKLDTIVGLFAAGEKPTGSRDPYGLRRAAQGVVKILVDLPAIAGTQRSVDLNALDRPGLRRLRLDAEPESDALARGARRVHRRARAAPVRAARVPRRRRPGGRRSTGAIPASAFRARRSARAGAAVEGLRDAGRRCSSGSRTSPKEFDGELTPGASREARRAGGDGAAAGDRRAISGDRGRGRAGEICGRDAGARRARARRSTASSSTSS